MVVAQSLILGVIGTSLAMNRQQQAYRENLFLRRRSRSTCGGIQMGARIAAIAIEAITYIVLLAGTTVGFWLLARYQHHY
jgi:hypothetical protein